MKIINLEKSIMVFLMGNKKESKKEEDDTLKLNETELKSFFIYYIRFIEKTIDEYDDFNTGDFSFSNTNYEIAMREINMDFDFLSTRRCLKNGVSKGKIAGIILFRFIKHPCIFPRFENEDNPHILFINNFVALFFVLEYFLNIDNIEDKNNKDKIIKEIAFSIAFRHINQETLGLIFDSNFPQEELETEK